MQMSSVKVWHWGKYYQVDWVVSCSNTYAVFHLWLSEYFNLHYFGVNLIMKITHLDKYDMDHTTKKSC